MTGHIEPIVGRYVHVEIDSTMHRIYFEENGTGIPLLCLHTAGSDGRQWRYLLADEAFADLLKKHGVPIDLKDALRKSAGVAKKAAANATSKDGKR